MESKPTDIIVEDAEKKKKEEAEAAKAKDLATGKTTIPLPEPPKSGAKVGEIVNIGDEKAVDKTTGKANLDRESEQEKQDKDKVNSVDVSTKKKTVRKYDAPAWLGR